MSGQGYGFWCWDCRTPMLRPTYEEARAAATAAGWRVIRGVDRCAACAKTEDQKAARTLAAAREINRRLSAGQVVGYGARCPFTMEEGQMAECLRREENAELRPGARFAVAADGWAMTPAAAEVEVVWVDRDGDAVHYRKTGDPAVRQTTVARFLEITAGRTAPLG